MTWMNIEMEWWWWWCLMKGIALARDWSLRAVYGFSDCSFYPSPQVLWESAKNDPLGSKLCPVQRRPAPQRGEQSSPHLPLSSHLLDRLLCEYTIYLFSRMVLSFLRRSCNWVFFLSSGICVRYPCSISLLEVVICWYEWAEFTRFCCIWMYPMLEYEICNHSVKHS